VNIWVVSTSTGMVKRAFFAKETAEEWIERNNLNDVYPLIYKLTEVEIGDESPTISPFDSDLPE